MWGQRHPQEEGFSGSKSHRRKIKKKDVVDDAFLTFPDSAISATDSKRDRDVDLVELGDDLKLLAEKVE